MSQNEALATLNEMLRKISAQDFQNLGSHEIAYIRSITTHNKTSFTVHSANGQRLCVMDTLADAVSVARNNDLEPVTVH